MLWAGDQEFLVGQAFPFHHPRFLDAKDGTWLHLQLVQIWAELVLGSHMLDDAEGDPRILVSGGLLLGSPGFHRLDLPFLNMTVALLGSPAPCPQCCSGSAHDSGRNWESSDYWVSCCMSAYSS